MQLDKILHLKKEVEDLTKNLEIKVKQRTAEVEEKVKYCKFTK